MKLDFSGKVNEKGELRIINRKDFDTCVAASFAGKDVVITLEAKRRKRSNPANRYYHGAVVPIIRAAFLDLGHRLTHDEVHDFLKNKFIAGEQIANKDAILIGEVRKTTKTMTPSAFSDYIAEIRQWSNEVLDVDIPEPMEQTTIAV